MNLNTRLVIRYLKHKLRWVFRPRLFPRKRKMHCKFEPGIKWDCLRAVVELARNDSMDNKTRIIEMTQHACCFTGSAAELLKDSPDDAPVIDPSINISFGATGEATAEQLCDQIESHIPDGEFGGVLDNVDWSAVLNTILPLILSLLQKKLS